MSQSNNKNEYEVDVVENKEKTNNDNTHSSSASSIFEIIKVIDKKIFFAILVFIGCVAASYYFFTGAAGKTAQTFSESYASTKAQVSQEVYEKYERIGYEKSEKKYHTSNRVTINIGTLKEKNALEVLSASDTYLNVVKKDDASEDSQRWVAIPGTAVYTVDLSMSEIIKDEYNRYILVRVKDPELANIKINYDDVNVYLYEYKQDWFKVNGTYEGGADEAQRDYAEAYSEMCERFYSDQKFYISARNSAEDIITSMVRNLNPEIPDLKVEVEFF